MKHLIQLLPLIASLLAATLSDVTNLITPEFRNASSASAPPEMKIGNSP